MLTNYSTPPLKQAGVAPLSAHTGFLHRGLARPRTCSSVIAPARENAPAKAQVKAKDGPVTQPVSPASTSADFWAVVSGTSSSFANQVLSHFPKLWAGGAMTQDAEKVIQEAASKEKAKQESTLPADISSFLSSVGVWELKNIRKLSHLCSLTYKMHQLTPRKLKRTHNLELVTTSWSCEIRPYEHAKTAEEVLDDGDGMAVSVGDARAAYNQLLGRKEIGNNIVPVTREVEAVSGTAAVVTLPVSKKKVLSPTDLVATKVAEAAMAASAVKPLASAAGTLLASIGAGPKPSPVAAAVQLSAAIAAMEPKPAATSSPSFSTGPSGTSSRVETRMQTTAQSTTGSPVCPSEWFVCDDVATQTRYFVIQGSDTLDHWKLNLTFDPVAFEDPSLGVKVHRGAYEAAQVMFERFLPMIYEHIDSSPFAKVCFTGHSIGGSLATLLMLICKHRRVLKSSQIATVYTFGSPAVFCETGAKPLQPLVATDKRTCSLQGCSCSSDPRQGLLHALDLHDHLIRNVVMHRDIVPRAFACDYSLVADILKGWGPSFRGHCCLSGDGRKHLYYFIGKLVVMQPDPWHWFVSGDADHPMLPVGPGLHSLGVPTATTLAAAARFRSSQQQQGLQLGCQPKSITEAIWALMDNPHPLEILADPGAYLEKGSISRYHNPDNYTAALGRLIYLQRKQEGKIPSWVYNATSRRLTMEKMGMQGLDDGGVSDLRPWDSSDLDFVVPTFETLSSDGEGEEASVGSSDWSE